MIGIKTTEAKLGICYWDDQWLPYTEGHPEVELLYGEMKMSDLDRLFEELLTELSETLLLIPSNLNAKEEWAVESSSSSLTDCYDLIDFY